MNPLVERFGVKVISTKQGFTVGYNPPDGTTLIYGPTLRRVEAPPFHRYTTSGQSFDMVIEIANRRGRVARRLEFVPGAQMIGSVPFSQSDANSPASPVESTVFAVGNQKGGVTQLQVLNTNRPSNRYVFASSRLVEL